MSQEYLAKDRGSTNWGDRKSYQHKSNQRGLHLKMKLCVSEIMIIVIIPSRLTSKVSCNCDGI